MNSKNNIQMLFLSLILLHVGCAGSIGHLTDLLSPQSDPSRMEILQRLQQVERRVARQGKTIAKLQVEALVSRKTAQKVEGLTSAYVKYTDIFAVGKASDKLAARSVIKRTSRHPVSRSDVKKKYLDKDYTFVSTHMKPLLDGTNDVSSKRELLLILGDSYFKTGEFAEAALTYDSYLSLRGNVKLYPFILRRVGDCFRLLQKPKQADIFYSELLQKYGQSRDAKIHLARIHQDSNG